MAGGRWDEAAAEVVHAPVTDAVPLARRKDGWWLYYLAGGGCFAVVVFLYQVGVIPGPTLLAYVLGAIPMSVLFQLSLTPVFAVLTPTGIQVTSGARWRPRPVAPVLGPLDPRVVSGPRGLFGNAFDIAGQRHQVGLPQKARFQRMLGTPPVGESAS